LEAIQQNGVRQAPDIDALATRAPGQAAVLLWNYHDDDIPAAGATVTVTIAGLPASVHRVLLQHYRIDDGHSNAYTAWKDMGSPQDPTPEQHARLEAAGQLQLLDSPRWITAEQGAITVDVPLPRTALSLLRVTYREQ
jgi:xylan 1,4-beta-xylosidase